MISIDRYLNAQYLLAVWALGACYLHVSDEFNMKKLKTNAQLYVLILIASTCLVMYNVFLHVRN